ncbi:MAG: hypothetical protein ACQESJ_06995 [Bacteroidota bacterium]
MFEKFEALGELGWMVLLIIILLIIWLFLRRIGKRDRRNFRSPSLKHLRSRYLKGQIDEEEYEKQKEEIQAKREE